MVCHRKRIKGGFRQLKSKNIVITAPEHAKDMFFFREYEDINQLIRRIDHIIDLNSESSHAQQLGNTIPTADKITDEQMH
jgi:hypothetical protein